MERGSGFVISATKMIIERNRKCKICVVTHVGIMMKWMVPAAKNKMWPRLEELYKVWWTHLSLEMGSPVFWAAGTILMDHEAQEDFLGVASGIWSWKQSHESQAGVRQGHAWSDQSWALNMYSLRDEQFQSLVWVLHWGFWQSGGFVVLTLGWRWSTWGRERAWR
jgi:hypothetical protein